MCADTCADMSAYMCACICADVCADMCADTCADMCADVCLDMILGSKVSHPNIIKLFEVIEQPTRKLLMMEYARGGDLCKYVRANRRLSEEACLNACLIHMFVEHVYVRANRRSL